MSRRPAARARHPRRCVAASLVAGACTTAGAYDPTPLYTPTSDTVAERVAVAQRVDRRPRPRRPAPTSPPPTACSRTRRPPPCRRPSQMPAGSTMDTIRKRGRLIAGVSADTLLLGARNPVTGQIEGFDIDMLHAVSQAIFGDPNKIELEGDHRRPARCRSLKDGSVDIVARTMTITCDRWKKIAFSSEYYRSGQKVLVRNGEKTDERRPDQRHRGPRRQEGLRPQRVDEHGQAAHLHRRRGRGRRHPHRLPGAVPAGPVDAITGDDTVLAGLAAQDPYADVVRRRRSPPSRTASASTRRTSTSCGSSTACSPQMRTDGRWTKSYNTWLADSLGKAPAPPQPVYGRAP